MADLEELEEVINECIEDYYKMMDVECSKVAKELIKKETFKFLVEVQENHDGDEEYYDAKEAVKDFSGPEKNGYATIGLILGRLCAQDEEEIYPILNEQMGRKYGNR